MDRKKVLGMVGVALVALAIGSIAPAGAAAEPAKTKAKLSLSYFPETLSRNFTVRVKSKKDSCKGGRSVSVFEKLDGEDNKIGSTTSNDGGLAFVEDSPAPPFESGETFYAKVAK